MTLEEQLKQEIISRYGSVLAFSKATGLKNSTLDSILTRGIYNSGVGKVMQIFDALGIDTESIAVGRIIYSDPKTKKSPAPSEDSAGENGKLSMDEVERVLLSRGLIKEGQDVTEDDLRFINSVLDLIDMWFKNRYQQG